MPIDPGSVGIIASSLSMATNLAKAAMGLRDFNELAAVVSKINDQLLKAQDGLLAHNAEMFALQQKYFEATEELRKVRETLDEKGRYSLFAIAPGNFAYRVNVSPQQSGAGEPGGAEPLHYVCQQCFDRGVKSILGVTPNNSFGGGYHYACWTCKREIPA